MNVIEARSNVRQKKYELLIAEKTMRALNAAYVAVWREVNCDDVGLAAYDVAVARYDRAKTELYAAEDILRTVIENGSN